MGDEPESKNFEINDFKLNQGPSSIYYVPNFISKSDENSLLQQISKTPKPRWTQLSNRRLQNWGGIPHPKGMIAEEIPSWLKAFTDKVASLNIFDGKVPNHVLINEYTAGQGIMPHLDGPLFHPTISTINLGSHTILNFYNPLPDTEDEEVKKNWSERIACSLLLQPRSLLILKESAYDHLLHGIEEITQDTLNTQIVNLDKCDNVNLGDILKRSTRISLTIRHVPKTSKAIIKLGK